MVDGCYSHVQSSQRSTERPAIHLPGEDLIAGMGTAMPIVHVLDRVKEGHGRGLSVLALADAQHDAGWDVRLLLSGVHSRNLLPSRPSHQALLGDLAVDVYRRVDAIDAVAVALEQQTRLGDVLICHGGVDLASACRLTNRWVVAAVHSDPSACLGYLPVGELELLRARTDHWIAWGKLVACQLSNLVGVDKRLITVSGQHIEPRRPAIAKLPGSPAW